MDGSTPATNSTGISTANSAAVSPGDANASQPHLRAASTGTRRGKQKQQQCRYFGTKHGCRAGDSCAFVHDASKLRDSKNTQDLDSRAAQNPPSAGSSDHIETETNIHQTQEKSGALPAPPERRRYHHGPVQGSRVVQRPVPQRQTNNPRDFQIQQLRRRFSPQELLQNGVTKLSFDLIPSDPDFPFETDALKCTLNIPLIWPADGNPSLTVTNTEMARGYQLNIEKGFDALVNESSNATLLGIINALDKRLETLLSAEKAETIKLVSNQEHVGRGRQQSVAHQQSRTEPQCILQEASTRVKRPEEVFTADEIRQAQAKRETETRHLEARLKRAPLFSKSSDGTVFTIPLEARRRGELPVPLQAVQSVNLVVPSFYNLQPCSIHILGVTRDAARGTEQAFERRAKDGLESSLMEHVNYLSQNMHIMATESVTESVTEEPKRDHVPPPKWEEIEGTKANSPPEGLQVPDDRNHIRIIPRPPEWTSRDHSDEEYDSSDTSIYDSGIESAEDDVDEAVQSTSETPGPEKGILLSFPSLELHGIELLELVSLGITIKCLLCKDTMDINGLRNMAKTGHSQLRTESCKKCANGLSLGASLDYYQHC
ncbi:MAG: hypothetical protein M1812_007641 [Candelaria pacifica]|nr:MAG: hypothetical protein M1812_007641 [Candelaria pacifica]